jgi:hypothetical protein
MIGNVTLPRTKQTIKPETKIIKALIKNPELQQYQMPKQTDISYRTILRTLKPMEIENLIKQIRTEPSKKGGKEKKIYSLTFKGALTYLNSLTPKPEDYFVKDNIYSYSHTKANEIIMKNNQPLTPQALASFIENLGNQADFQIFKQIKWLQEHFELDVFRAIVKAATKALDKDKLPSLNQIKESMLSSGDKTEDIELTLKDFRHLEDNSLREEFTEAFAHELSSIKGNGNLHNDTLEQLITKIISRIEKRNQETISPLKQLAQTLK